MSANESLRERAERFLYREARLLDERRYRDWLGLLTDDVRYWAPVPENRFRNDETGVYRETGAALFDDRRRELERRIARFENPTAWAEDPPCRTVRVVANVEVEETGVRGECEVHSTIVVYRNRGDYDENVVAARRRDLLREVESDLRLTRRTIYLTQNVLQSRNLNFFL